MIIWKALILGIVEGITEFLPISSTGHLILASRFVDYPDPLRTTFEIFIQLGAILAVVWNFREPLRRTVMEAGERPAARHLLLKVGIAFCPAAIAGLLFGDWIQEHLFTPRLVGATLMVGGVAIIAIERMALRFDTTDIEATSWRAALLVGFAQVLSLIPGVSRAGATIMGGLAAGLQRPVATVFSFYLSIPTMVAASLYSLYGARHLLGWSDVAPLAIGFLAAFVSALIVVRAFLGYVQRHDFQVFGVYRIIVGLLVLALVR